MGDPSTSTQAQHKERAAEQATVEQGLPLCDHCEAVCCRLTVVLMPDDRVPHWLVAESDTGPDTMAKGDDGWCVALDRDTMSCSIYAQRPQICRSFSMGGAYCRDERSKWARENSRPGIPFVWR